MGFQEGSCLIGFGVLSLEQDLVRGFGENLVWGSGEPCLGES